MKKVVMNSLKDWNDSIYIFYLSSTIKAIED